MPEKSVIKAIPVELPFLRILAEYLKERYKDCSPDFSKILLIFPSQRNKFYFRRYLLECSNISAVIPPVMKTIDEIMEDIFEYCGGREGRRLNMIERNFILKQVIDSLKIEFWQELSFLRFISIGCRLLGFFDELAKEQVSFERLEEEIVSGHYPERYVKNELFIIKSVYQKYREKLSALDYCDDIDKYDLIHQKCNIEFLKPYKYIGIAGLVATTAVENSVIQRILQELPAELILHTSLKNDDKDVDTTSPFYLHYKMLQAVVPDGNYDIQFITEEKSPPPVYHIKRTETESQQTFHLQQVLCKIKGRYEPHRIAVILTDEGMIYAVAESLKTVGCEYNISAGLPFTQSILYSFLDHLKDFVDSKFHYKELFSLIKHPLFKNASFQDKPLRPIIYQFIQFMVEKKQNYFIPDQRYDETFDPLIYLIKDCIKTVSADLSLSDYVDNLTTMLNTILSCNQEFIKRASPDIDKFFESLHRFTKLRIPKRMIEGGLETLEFLLRLIQDERFNLIGDPMKGVQVIGLLEARNLDFDCIIISSMNEGIFPKYSEKDLFVNQSVRRQVGLPYDKERENLYYYYFTEMINSKKEVFLSYIEEENRNIRSRFIDFLEEKNIPVDRTPILFDNTAIKTPEGSVAKNRNILNYLYNLVSGRGLAPTNLKDYRECSYRFFLRYVAALKEPEEIIEEAGACEWGRILHGALRNFYKYRFPEGLEVDRLEEAKQLLYKEAQEVLRQELAQKPTGVTFFDLEIYRKRLEKFLEYELTRFKEGYRINNQISEERKEHTEIIGNVKVKLYGYPDRVDMYEGRYYIIDYKTTVPEKKKYRLGEDFVEFQLPLYALLLTGRSPEMICGLAYYEISKSVRIVEITEKDSVARYLAEFKEEILLPTIREILDESIPFSRTTDQKNCTFCLFKDLCGVNYER